MSGWVSRGLLIVGGQMGAINSQWVVLRIGGANFLHCWFTNSIKLERTEPLITNDSFHGSLFRALTNFKVVLPVNNSVVYGLLLGLVTHYKTFIFFLILLFHVISFNTNLTH